MVLLYCRSPAEAVIILEEYFHDYSLINAEETSAHIDTDNNWARLPEKSLSSAITILQESPGFAAATREGIKVYEYDDSADAMEYNSVYSIPWAIEATGVAIRQDNLNIWGITPNSVAYYRYNGSGMSDDPNLKVLGLNNVLSVAGFHEQDSAIVLERTGDNKAKITRYDASGQLVASNSINTGITDPVSVSMVNQSPDFWLYTKSSAYYFIYDDLQGTYIADPSKIINGLNDVVSASSDDIGNSILTPTSIDYYMNLDGGGIAHVTAFSPGTASGAVAVALRPGSYDQILINKSGHVRWWTYDDATDSMKRVPAYEASGFVLNEGYVTRAKYVSQEVVTIEEYSHIRIRADTNIPGNTSIEWLVSTDNGLSFIEVDQGMWTEVQPSTSYIIEGVLTTEDSTITPYIFSVLLELNSPPNTPVLPDYGTCFVTTTPTLLWTFSDPDEPDDEQTAYHVQVVRASDYELILDSGKTYSPENQYIVPTSTVPEIPGPLWASGTNQFKYRVMAWDKADIQSPWSEWGNFCVYAFERPRIREIVSTPDMASRPTPEDMSTHLMIARGTSQELLPVAKAGTKVGLLLDSIGPFNTSSARFPYKDTEATLGGPPEVVHQIGINKHWLVEFWTDANKEICPDGTIVMMESIGTGSSGTILFNMNLEEGAYAEGVIKTQGTVFDDWIAVLRGRDTGN